MLLLIPAFGVDCEYFDPVKVPAVDTHPPILATRAWIGGEEQLSPTTIEEVLGPGEGDIVIAPGMWDSGGARSFTLTQTVRVTCHDDDANPPLSQLISMDFFPRVANQAGSVGSTVSNGLYILGDVTDLASYELYCDSGFDLHDVRYSWSMVGRDFAGNQTAMNGGTIVYEP